MTADELAIIATTLAGLRRDLLADPAMDDPALMWNRVVHTLSLNFTAHQLWDPSFNRHDFLQSAWA